MKLFSQYELNVYLCEVRSRKTLDDEIERVQNLLRGAETHPDPDKEKQVEFVKKVTQLFRVLLTEKAREKVVQEVRQDNASNTQYGGTRPAYNPARRIGVWNILKQKVAGSG